MNKINDAIRHHFRVSMSLNLAQMIMKPVPIELIKFSLLSPQLAIDIPVYVTRYAMTTQPVLLKPWRSLAMVTNAVLTIETSRLGRKIAIETLFN
jgi:ABC-type transport system involved in cytochrome c biogenesis permease subunit